MLETLLLALVPNLLTLLRCLAALPVAWMILYDHWLLASIVLAAACATDWLDGYLARRWNATSAFGIWADPLADKILLLGCFAGFTLDKNLPGFFLICMAVIAVREVWMLIWRSVQAGNGVQRPASMTAKIKTGLQFGCLFGIIYYCSQAPSQGLFFALSALLVITAVLTWQSALAYLRG